MFDKQRLQHILAEYKGNYFPKHFSDENFKWKAIKNFQDSWDINAPDFAEMLKRSLSGTYGLLESQNFFPKGMITGFAGDDPEGVRSMFVLLFDESRDLYERINSFKDEASIMLKKYASSASQHYQNENAITTYLWLKYPDKYYIYKYGEVKKVAEELSSDCLVRKGAYANNIRNSFKLYDEIADALREDQELVNLVKSQITDDCYHDPELRTLTIDVGFYISRYVTEYDNVGTQPTIDVWGPKKEDYDPCLTVQNWVDLLHDKTIFRENDLKIVKRYKDYGGEATCKQLSIRYGETPGFYNLGSSKLGQRISKKTGCPLYSEGKNVNYWPVLYYGRIADKDEEGSYKWKLREELSEALDMVDLSKIDLYEKIDEEDRRYWWLNANPKIWSFLSKGIKPSG